MANKKANGVWMMELDRFGYTLRVVARTKEDALAAMQEEYIGAYAKHSGLDPVDLCTTLLCANCYVGMSVETLESLSDEEYARAEFLQYYRTAFEENEPRFYEYGKVEWE